MSAKITDLAKKYSEIQDKSKAQAEVAKAINAEWTECEAELLEAMVEEGVKSLNIDGVGMIMMRTTTRLSVNIAEKPILFKYLEDIGSSGILKLDINPKTLASWLDSHLAELINKEVANGKDMVDAREAAIQFLHEKAGASYFSKREIALKRV